MKHLFSRYGGHLHIIGKGKASNEKLPEDQSLDSMLTQLNIVDNDLGYFSSYDMCPAFMGAYKLFPIGLIKLGSISHDFNEISIQHSITASTAIYIGYHDYKNVYCIFIKTDLSNLNDYFGKLETTYDYVLTIQLLNQETYLLQDHPKLLEKLLIILFYKMELHDGLYEFKPSKTFLGKKISAEFIENIKQIVHYIDSDEELLQVLNNYANTEIL